MRGLSGIAALVASAFGVDPTREGFGRTDPPICRHARGLYRRKRTDAAYRRRRKWHSGSDRQTGARWRPRGDPARTGGRMNDRPVADLDLDAPTERLPLRLDHFSAVNVRRSTSQDGFNHPLDAWSVAEWTNAIAGEAGEACNLAKKLIRFRDDVAGNVKVSDQNQADLRARLAEEIADVVIYCDLATQALGYDLGTVLREVFNRKSRDIGAYQHILLPEEPARG